MRANRTGYLFSVKSHTPPTMSVDSGEEFTVEVRGAFDDVEDIRAVPTPFTPACDGRPWHPLLDRLLCAALSPATSPNVGGPSAAVTGSSDPRRLRWLSG